MCLQITVQIRKYGTAISWASGLGLLGTVPVATTDNVFVYPFVMYPLGLLIGIALTEDEFGPAKTQGKV